MKCLFYKFLMDCTLFVTSRSIDNKGHFTFIMVERPILFSSNTFYPIQVTPRFFREFLRKADTKDKLLTLGLFHTHLVPHKVSVTPRWTSFTTSITLITTTFKSKIISYKRKTFRVDTIFLFVLIESPLIGTFYQIGVHQDDRTCRDFGGGDGSQSHTTPLCLSKIFRRSSGKTFFRPIFNFTCVSFE